MAYTYRMTSHCTLAELNMRTTLPFALFLLFCLPAQAGKLVYAPPPPVLLDDVPGKNEDAKQPALAEATLRGKLLYENHCTSCHESLVHIRERHTVTSLPQLQAQVRRWADYAKLKWGKDEVEDVVRYLNNRHYRF